MGHLINPISTRLGFSAFWLSTWTNFSLKDFSYNLMLDYGIASLMEWIFIHSWFAELLTRNGIFLSHYRLARRGKKIRFHAFLIYNSSILLKSSFVEPNTQANPTTDWLSVWAKHHFDTKIQNTIKGALVQTGYQSSSNLHLSSEVRSIIKQHWQGLPRSSSLIKGGVGKGRRIPAKATNLLNYKVRMRKLQLTRLLEFSNSFFSRIVSSIASNFLSKVSSFKDNELSIGLRFLSTFSVVNPQFLARFIARRISYGFPLNRVIRPIMKDLTRLMGSNKCKIIGFRIACSGRFDRKQMASYAWHKSGPVSLNRFDANINYGYATAFLKYGTCGIKVWIASKHHVLKSQLAVRQAIVDNFVYKNICLIEKNNKADVFNSRLLFELLKSFILLDEFFVWSTKKKAFDLLNCKVLLPSSLNRQLSNPRLNTLWSKRIQLLITQWVRYENFLLAFKANT